MAKKAKKQLNPSTHQQKVVTIYGYGIFVIWLLSFIIWSLVPWVRALFVAHVNTNTNTPLFVAFLITTLVPPIATYLFGDRATRGKSVLRHHYNGILMGVAGYFLYSGLSSMSFLFPWPFDTTQPFGFFLDVVIPVVPALAISLVVAIRYAHRKRATITLLQDRWYQIMLLGGIVLIHLYVLAPVLNAFDAVWYGAILSGISVFIWIVSFFIYRHAGTVAPATSALLALCLTLAFTTVVSSLTVSLVPVAWVTFVSAATALVGWIGYLVLSRR